MNSRKIVFAAAAVLAAGIYFRTYALHPLRAGETPGVLARRAVEKSLSEQIRKAVDQEFSSISPEARQRLAEERARQIMEADKAGFEGAVRNAEESLRQNMPAGPRARWASRSGRHYLLEADPYYFYYQTQKILETGRVSDQIKNGRFFNPLQSAPKGYWPPFNLHPYAGAVCHCLIQIFRPHADLMETLSCVPLVLLVFVVAVYFLLAPLFGTGLAAITLGGLSLVLSPIFIQRSAFGWYDSDPYNYIFPGLVLALFFAGTRSGKKCLIAGAVAGFLTGFYSFFWNGWPFIFVLTIAGSVTGWIAGKIPWGRDREVKSFYAPFLLTYAGSALFFAALFMTPAGFVNAIVEGWTVSQQFALSKSDLWPNIFLTVGEAQGISLKKMIFLIGNYITVGAAFGGWAVTGLKAVRGNDRQGFREWAVLSAFTLPLILMSFKTERFCLLLVLPMALFVMLGAEKMKQWSENFMAALSRKDKRPDWVKTAAAAAVFLIMLPLQMVTAHVVANGIHPIMNDTWFEVMKQLREKTSESAIVSSWWPPGYFVSGLAGRRTTSDGGTQHLKQPYWMARFFLAPDERVAAGLLRMLNTSGNDAVEYLESAGVDLPDIIDLIPQIVSVSRGKAAGLLPPALNGDSKQHLLDLTHGKGVSPPAYVLVYDDLMDQNLAVSMLASWDFRKARAFQEKSARARKNRGILSFFRRPPLAAYLQEVFDISNGIMRYTPAAELVRREGDLMLFKNGLVVNLKDMTSYLSLPEKGVNGQPMSFFYMKDGALMEQSSAGERVDASALLISENGGFMSVVADPRLLRSMLFRLYYLKGEGLRFFKPFIREYDPLTKTRLIVYEFDNAAWEEAAPAT